jgi:leucyl aminopeptidase
MMVFTLVLAAGIRGGVRVGMVRGASAFAPIRVSASRLRGGVSVLSMSTSTRDLMGTALATPGADVSIATAATGMSEWQGDLLVALVQQSEDEKAEHAELTAELSALDAKLDGTIAAVIADSAFKAKPGDSKVITLPPKYGVKKVALIGVGKKPTVDTAVTAIGASAKWGASAASMARAERPTAMALAVVPGTSVAEMQVAMEAMFVGLVSDDRFKDLHPEALKTADERKLKLKSVQVLQSPPGSAEAIERARGMADGILLTKALVNSPANYLTPTALAKTAERLSSELGLALEVRALRSAGAGNGLCLSPTLCQPGRRRGGAGRCGRMGPQPRLAHSHGPHPSPLL